MSSEIDKLMKQNEILQDTLRQLDQTWREKKSLREEVSKKRTMLETELHIIKHSTAYKLMKTPQKMKSFAKESGAYVLGRRDKRQLYSKAYRQKKASNALKNEKYHLYTLGFIEKSLQNLEEIYRQTESSYLKQAAAWELALWYANKYTVMDAAIALRYLKSIANLRDKDGQRKLTILLAECLERCGERFEAKEVIHKQLANEKHPDLYAALANTETNDTEKLQWINHVLSHYGLERVGLHNNEETVPYNNLYTISTKEKIMDGPKVSIIIPAYNAADGIHIAIDSMLTQTWQQVEVIVVDDCSTDDTVRVVKDIMKKDPRVKLFSTGKNSGPYVARNIGLMQATGEFVTVNDSDDWSHAEKIEIQVKHLIEHPSIIANTSQLARMTEDLTFYRRGNPGEYVFTNMSSLMFRKEPIQEQLGAWDSVRFAADSEFIQRIIKVFGKNSIVNLSTGPLSLARQSASSLTGSSVFGYNGFLMGIRKEYRDSYRYYHQHASSLYYDFPMKKRPYPVPEPLRLERESRPRQFDVVIAADFRSTGQLIESIIEEIQVHQERGLRTGLIQMNEYNRTGPKDIHNKIRECINGDDVQFLVYGEEIHCTVLLVKDPTALSEKQKYIPNVKADTIKVVIYTDPIQHNKKTYSLRKCSQHLVSYFDNLGRWYPYSQKVRDNLKRQANNELKYVKLTKENWQGKSYDERLNDWLVEDNPFNLGKEKGDGFVE
ncbi:glycosyltransferase family 2 protein [Ornithinibacillus halotolerans]|uniref:Glycosyltransferase 2-like domain-containing protein n=1 Tax=Ornithinibacillus halotolerans TaxID=1274357 RepID=A0A916W4E4_9BACI|nr:glycosyltransferase family A protein [Ornithinibacillus halotolerans]GGA64710.1 hypothetical protein GCM10008025_05700 [Ornithinibacillus halotolerans]